MAAEIKGTESRGILGADAFLLDSPVLPQRFVVRSDGSASDHWNCSGYSSYVDDLATAANVLNASADER